AYVTPPTTNDVPCTRHETERIQRAIRATMRAICGGNELPLAERVCSICAARCTVTPRVPSARATPDTQAQYAITCRIEGNPDLGDRNVLRTDTLAVERRAPLPTEEPRCGSHAYRLRPCRQCGVDVFPHQRGTEQRIQFRIERFGHLTL